MLAEGDRLPDFTLKAATRDGVRDVTTADLVPDRGKTVFAFYPHAFSGTCTEQLCDLRDTLGDLQTLGARVFGFSTDTHFVNRAYAAEQRLDYPLLCDPHAEVAARIWELQEVAGVRDRVKRGLLVVDAQGVVTHVWKTDDPNAWPGLDDLRKHLEADDAGRQTL